jgi:hypothetical protein
VNRYSSPNGDAPASSALLAKRGPKTQLKTWLAMRMPGRARSFRTSTSASSVVPTKAPPGASASATFCSARRARRSLLKA